MKIRKGDNVLIISGKNKGKKGSVLKTFPGKGKIIVQGVNLAKKHQKAKRSGEKGQMVELPLPIDVSNVKLICQKCSKAVRIGYKIVQDKKFRICKRCQKEI